MTAVLSHQTVLLREAVEALTIKPAGVHVDGTFGRAGTAGPFSNNWGRTGGSSPLTAIRRPSRRASNE